jgi:hypothetical protein
MILYDAAKKRIYVSCGEGFVNIFQQQDANHYYAVATVPTAPGARTSLFVPELHRFYHAVPHIANQQSEASRTIKENSNKTCSYSYARNLKRYYYKYILYILN